MSEQTPSPLLETKTIKIKTFQNDNKMLKNFDPYERDTGNREIKVDKIKKYVTR